MRIDSVRKWEFGETRKGGVAMRGEEIGEELDVGRSNAG